MVTTCADDRSVIAINSDVRAAGDVHGAVVLVQHYLLWAELSCWWAVSCIIAVADSRWLHWPIEQWQVLSGTSV